jgi:hypothetical protein
MFHRLLIALVALMLLGSAAAEGNRTLTCSVSGAVAGCLVEQPVFVLGPLEFSVGVDAQWAYDGVRTSFFAPYALVGWYASSWSVWAEFALPDHRIPTFGKPEPWRVGFRVRF